MKRFGISTPTACFLFLTGASFFQLPIAVDGSVFEGVVGVAPKEAVESSSSYPGLMRNPFIVPKTISDSRKNRSAAPKIISAQDLELKAILFSADNPLVNLNGEIISIGDEVQGYRLEKVYESHVELSKQQKVYRLEIKVEEPA